MTEPNYSMENDEFLEVLSRIESEEDKNIIIGFLEIARREERELFKQSHLQKDNHRIGIELESYTNVLFYRGFEREERMLSEVASRLK